MSTTIHVHTLREYIAQAMPILTEIPGFSALGAASEQDNDATAAVYPDAVFAMMVMNNLFHHDWEFAAIHQQAFSSIVARLLRSIPEHGKKEALSHLHRLRYSEFDLDSPFLEQFQKNQKQLLAILGRMAEKTK